MPKYWGKQIFSLGSFPEVGKKQKTEREERPRVAHANPPGPKQRPASLLSTTKGGKRKILKKKKF